MPEATRLPGGPEVMPADYWPRHNDGLTKDSQFSAFKALARGEANDHQQRACLHFLLAVICRLGEPRMALMSEREAGFRDGLLHAGITVAHMAGLQMWRPADETKDTQ